jgi:hypothetical protein
MLLLREPDVFLLMGSAMAVALPALWVLERTAWHAPGGALMRLSRSNIERKHVFGSGWAITGACPGTALAMPAAGVSSACPSSPVWSPVRSFASRSFLARANVGCAASWQDRDPPAPDIAS